MVVFCNSDESQEKERLYLRMLLEKRVDGILLVPVSQSPEIVTPFQQQNLPVVILDRALPGVQADLVRCDSEEGARQLTRLLLDLRHRHIALLTGPKEVSTSADRVRGYCRALKEAGLPDGSQSVYYGEFNQASGYAITRRAFEQSPRPTAIFSANNFLTLGALNALQGLGLRVPEDIAVVGFDDIPAAIIGDPFLTVASQPAYEMGKIATEMLLERLGAQPPTEFQTIILPTPIVIRRSSGGQI